MTIVQSRLLRVQRNTTPNVASIQRAMALRAALSHPLRQRATHLALSSSQLKPAYSTFAVSRFQQTASSYRESQTQHRSCWVPPATTPAVASAARQEVGGTCAPPSVVLRRWLRTDDGSGGGKPKGADWTAGGDADGTRQEAEGATWEGLTEEEAAAAVSILSCVRAWCVPVRISKWARCRMLSLLLLLLLLAMLLVSEFGYGYVNHGLVVAPCRHACPASSLIRFGDQQEGSRPRGNMGNAWSAMEVFASMS